MSTPTTIEGLRVCALLPIVSVNLTEHRRTYAVLETTDGVFMTVELLPDNTISAKSWELRHHEPTFKKALKFATDQAGY